jgi:hypothetical protein
MSGPPQWLVDWTNWIASIVALIAAILALFHVGRAASASKRYLDARTKQLS